MRHSRALILVESVSVSTVNGLAESDRTVERRLVVTDESPEGSFTTPHRDSGDRRSSRSSPLAFRPRSGVPQPWLDPPNPGEVGRIAGHQNESVLPSGSGDETIVQEAPPQPAAAQVPTGHQSGHDSRRSEPGRVARRDDPAQVFERRHPILMVLAVARFVSGADQDLLRDGGVLEEERREAPLKRSQGRVPLVGRDRRQVEVGVDDELRQLRLRIAGGVGLAERVTPGTTPSPFRARSQTLAECDEVKGQLNGLGFGLGAEDPTGGVQL